MWTPCRSERVATHASEEVVDEACASEKMSVSKLEEHSNKRPTSGAHTRSLAVVELNEQ